MSEVVTPGANSVEAFQAAITSYKQQFDQAQTQLAQLEQNYQTQKEKLTAMLHMLSGAVAALEQLVKNVVDEKALNPPKAVIQPTMEEPVTA